MIACLRRRVHGLARATRRGVSQVVAMLLWSRIRRRLGGMVSVHRRFVSAVCNLGLGARRGSGLWVASVLLLTSAAVAACEASPSNGELLARDLGAQLSQDLRTYKDTGAPADLQSARSLCEQVKEEAGEGRLYGTAYGRMLSSACDVVEVLGEDPRARVETAISLVDIALGMLQ